MKFKDWLLYIEKEKHSNINWMNDCSPSSQDEHTFRQLSKTLLPLIEIVVLYLNPDQDRLHKYLPLNFLL